MPYLVIPLELSTFSVHATAGSVYEVLFMRWSILRLWKMDTSLLALLCPSLLRRRSTTKANSELILSQMDELPACASTRQANCCSWGTDDPY